MKTVEQASGLTIDHYLEVSFAGFVKMVNAIDGVDVCTPAEIYDPPSGLQLPAGRSTLKGRDALAYVRAREFDPTADIGRMKRQQSFVASMVNKASSSAVLLDPARATGFVNAVLATRVDQSLDNSQVLELTRRLAQLESSQVTFRTVPVTGERSMGAIGNVVTWDGPGSSDLFTALRNDTPIPDKPSAPRVKVGPGDIRVQLLGTGDLATNATEDFDAAGYYLVGPRLRGLDGDHDRVRPRIQRVVEDAQAALPDAQTVAVPGLGSTFRVTVGADYAGVTQVSVKDPTAPDAPRTAASDICG